MDVSRYLPCGMEYGGLRTLRRIEPKQPADSGHKHPSILHAVKITHPVPVFHRISRETVVHVEEFILLRVRKHRQSPSEGADPYLSVPILLDGIYIIGTQR